MDEETKRRANLRVLQRLDKSTTDIICSATHVVLYQFSEADQQWEKRDIEGSLFISQHDNEKKEIGPGGYSKFKLVVLNRNSTENLEIPVGPDFQMQVREPYLIFRQSLHDKNGGGNILGLWFHDGSERVEVAKHLETVKSHAAKGTYRRAEKQEQPEDDTTLSTPQKLNAGETAAMLLSPLKIDERADSSPVQGSSSKQQSENPPSQPNMVLDKKALQLSLLSLIQDDRFIDIIHSQYIKVLKSRKQQISTESGDTIATPSKDTSGRK